MKPWQRFALLALVLAPLATAAQQRPAAAVPGVIKPAAKPLAAAPATAVALPPIPLQTDSTVFRFGEVQQGSMVRHTFRLRNTGTEPLTIRDVRTSCGCTSGRAPSQPLAPGAIAELDVAFYTGGRLGPQDKTVSVIVAGRQPLVLHIAGVITSPVLPLTRD